MEIIETPLKDCLIIKLPLYGDERGFFLESFNQRMLAAANVPFDVKQINFAKSAKNVLRGLHYQEAPSAQAKLVGVIAGSVMDVAVDVRPESPTYLQHFKLTIAQSNTFLLVPRGFAHGYFTLEDHTIFHYAVDQYFDPQSEKGIKYDDPLLNIDWELKEEPIISEKDLKQPYLNK